MERKVSFYWITLILSCSCSLFSQKDTILAKIKTNGSDTSEVRKYITAGEIVYLNDLGKAAHYWQTAYEKTISFSKRNEEGTISFNRLQSDAGEVLSNLGYVYNSRGMYDSALVVLNHGLELKQKFGRKHELADIYNNIAFAQMQLANYTQSIKNHLKSLRIREEAKDQNGIADSYINIASVYDKMGDTKNSRENYKKSLENYKITNNKVGIVNCMNSFAVICVKNKQYEEAMRNLKEGLKISEEGNFPYLKLLTLHNLGYYYQMTFKYDTALYYYKKCFDSHDSAGSFHDAVAELNNIAFCYMSLKKYPEALNAAKHGLRLNSKVNDLAYRKSLYSVVYNTYKSMGKINEAFDALLTYQSLTDSLNLTKLRDDALKQQMQYEFGKQIAADSLEFEQQKKINEVKLREQKTVSYFSIFAILSLVIVIYLVVRNLRTTKMNNNIISEQKKIVEEKNKEIIDSINYAKRLQNAILTSDKIMASVFKESFVLFKPKDIVSGDFYWINFTKEKNTLVLAAADCTGHGVPGAFMSMLNSTLLNQTPYNPNINTPADTLNFLNEELPKNLKANSEKENINDGMDIAYCSIDLSTNNMKFAGANNSCWIIRANELIELKALKQAITAATGYEKKKFIDQEIALQKGDSVYLFTDGYADQFGGPHGKKFKYKALSELLIKISHEKSETQKQLLERAFMDWKGDLEQVDDVLIIGVKI